MKIIGLALEPTVKATPDGHTLLSYGTSVFLSQIMQHGKLVYDPFKDLTPITLTATSPLVLVVTPSLPVKSVAELVAYAKTNPGKLNHSSSNPGSSSHLTPELFKRVAGVNMVSIPYKSASQELVDPYTAAVAAVDGFVGIESFTDEKRFSRGVVEMLKRVTVKVNGERPSTFSEMWSEVTLRFKEGRSRHCRVGLLRGVSGGEPLTRDERLTKFMHCASRAITQEQAQRVVALVDRIETLDSMDELCALLRGSVASAVSEAAASGINT